MNAKNEKRIEIGQQKQDTPQVLRREKNKTYYEKNKDKIREKYAKRNYTQQQESTKKNITYYEKNKDKIRENNTIYYKNHKKLYQSEVFET